MRLRYLRHVVVSKRSTNCEKSCGKSCDQSCVQLVEQSGAQWSTGSIMGIFACIGTKAVLGSDCAVGACHLSTDCTYFSSVLKEQFFEVVTKLENVESVNQKFFWFFGSLSWQVICAPFMGKPKWVIGWAMVGRAEFAPGPQSAENRVRRCQQFLHVFPVLLVWFADLRPCLFCTLQMLQQALGIWSHKWPSRAEWWMRGLVLKTPY